MRVIMTEYSWKSPVIAVSIIGGHSGYLPGIPTLELSLRVMEAVDEKVLAAMREHPIKIVFEDDLLNFKYGLK